MPRPIALTHHRCDVSFVQQELETAQWNEHTMRVDQYQSPHKVSDIWLRFNKWSNYDGDQAAFVDEHESVWYPQALRLPRCVLAACRVAELMGARQLGGVLITKIPPSGEVAPHVDRGWHAEYYDKAALQIQGNKDQGFHFDGCSVSALPGQIYRFDNSQTHWVTNDSDEDRITMIVCYKRSI